MVQTNLEGLDELCQRGISISPAFFFAALFGPRLEADTLVRHRDGIPRQQAMDDAYAIFRDDSCKNVSMPVRVGDRLRRIITFQHSLHRMPPRRPAVMVNRPEFSESLAYLRLSAVRAEKNLTTILNWWDNFLSAAPSIVCSEPPGTESPVKRRRKRRRRRPLSIPAAAPT